jgi:uncharacterized lipoprotein YajG
MKKLSVLLGLLMLAGCSEPMKSEQIIAEYEKCQKAGLRAKPFYNTGLQTINVQCMLPNEGYGK